MKKRMRRLLASLAVLLAVISGAQGGFKLEPIGPEMGPSLAAAFGQRFCPYRPDLKANKLPDGAQNVKLGRIALDCVNPILFGVYSSTGGQALDTLVFDLNNDKDLTNDPKHTVPPQRKKTPSQLPVRRSRFKFPRDRPQRSRFPFLPCLA
jgi:hypothetical protein